MTNFQPGVRVHVVGVGGAGMSGLALLLREMGADVSGSDATESDVLRELEARGVVVHAGHDEKFADGATVVTWSPAVPHDHVELVRGRSNGAMMLPRSAALADLAQEKPVLGLTGTHGKTTATSMMVQISLAGGRDDAWLLGAPVLGVGANGHWGEGDLILEVDESYGTFELLAPHALGVLNVEADHLDHYGTLDNVERAFRELIERTSGPVVVWTDDAGASRVAKSASRTVFSVGTNDDATWRVHSVVMERRASTFVLEGDGQSLAISLRVTGRHNVANAAVVAVLALAVGIDATAVQRGLSNFLGAPRRFQYHGQWRGMDVYEDYAHLPGEIAATIAATKEAGYQRILAVFQPHRISRTRALGASFAPALRGVEHVIVTDIYSAGEANPTNLTGEIVATALRDDGTATSYAPSLRDVIDELAQRESTEDVLLILGAGDVGTLAADLPGGVA